MIETRGFSAQLPSVTPAAHFLRGLRRPRLKFAKPGTTFGRPIAGIVRGRRTPATNEPLLSVSIRVYPWLPTSRSYSGAILNDASGVAEPRWKISG